MYASRMVSVANTAELADTNFLTTNLGPLGKIPTLIRVSLAYSAAGIFELVLVPSGGSAVDILLNEGNALVAEALYTFDIPLHGGDAFNFKMSTAGTIRIFSVSAISEGV